METESQPTGTETGFQPGPEPDSDGGEGGEGVDPAEPAAPANGGEQPGGQQPPRETRAQRRDRFNETLELRKALQEMTRANEQAQSRHQQEMQLLRQSIEAGRPQREDPLVVKRKALDDRYTKIVTRLDKDPSAGEEFRELMAEYGRLGAEEFAGKQPAPRQATPPNAILQRIVGEFPWLDTDSGDHAAIALANGYVARLVKQEKRNMQDPQVRYTTLRQGAAMAAKDMGYPVGDNVGGTTNGRERVAGSGGRGGNQGASDSDLSSLPAADVLAAAKIMYPNDDDALAVKKWKGNAGRHLASFRK